MWQVGGVAALRVKGNFIFDKASHRDMLGACLGTGIDRSKVGDVLLLGEQGAHILVVPELAEYLTMNLTSVPSLLFADFGSSVSRFSAVASIELRLRPAATFHSKHCKFLLHRARKCPAFC